MTHRSLTDTRPTLGKAPNQTSDLRSRFNPVCVFLTTMVLTSPTAALESGHMTLTCIHFSGNQLFGGKGEITVRRSGPVVTVTSNSNEPITSDEKWTYRIAFEAAPTGFRAYRASKPGGGEGALDFVLGGELFYVLENGKQRIEVSAINAASGDASFERFRCQNAP